MDGEPPRHLRLLAAELPAALREPALSVAKHWSEALDDREALSLAYARLFLGPFEILSPPYASFYLEADQRLMGEVSQHVAQAYSEVWLGPGSGPHEAPDHVALEWEFMYFLTYQYVTTGEAHWLERRQSFHIDHLNHWIPELSKAILKANEHSFYDALALLSVTALNQ
jgi:TorA maturation chaperone TorD